MNDNNIYHVPVMLREVEEYLLKNPDGVYMDATAGGGGHSKYLLEKYPGIKIAALDRDPDAIRECEKTLAAYNERVKLIETNFRDMPGVLQSAGINKVDGMLFDLGVSSHQFDSPERGFSFKSMNLDMRMDGQISQNALDLLTSLSEDELSDVLFKFGEEWHSRRISRIIKKEKDNIKSATDLAELISRVRKREGKTHPATKTFQALRIKVNNELENLSVVLDSIPPYLKPGARVVVLSYHSLEDRIVKNNFRDMSKNGTYNLLTKKIVTPGVDEINANPRSRSAKLRAVEKL